MSSFAGGGGTDYRLFASMRGVEIVVEILCNCRGWPPSMDDDVSSMTCMMSVSIFA